MFITIILFLIGFVLITKGADIFINCTVDIGKKTNISEIILGATIVSFATTLPELTVSLFASLDGHTTMSLGNAVGSIICNTGLVLGLVAFISPFRVDKNMFFSKSVLLLICVVLLLLLGIDKKITKIDSIPLLAMLAIYMYSNYRSGVGNGSRSRGNNTLKVKGNNDFREWAKIILIFVLGLIMMVIGSRLLVDNGVIIAEWSTSRGYKSYSYSTWNVFTRISIIINSNKEKSSCYICWKYIRCKCIKYSICNRNIFYTKRYTYTISKYEYRFSIYDTFITYINITNY